MRFPRFLEEGLGEVAALRQELTYRFNERTTNATRPSKQTTPGDKNTRFESIWKPFLALIMNPKYLVDVASNFSFANIKILSCSL